MNVSNNLNPTQLDWDIRSVKPEDLAKFDSYWVNRSKVSPELFKSHPRIHLEIGAGTGWFVSELAKRYPDRSYVAIERSRMRGRRLVKKAEKLQLANFTAFRGNAIPMLTHQIPDGAVERIYILYPCPWPRQSQRKNRWYLHPIMPHLARILKKGGQLIWASDQKFYIDEARYVTEKHFGLKVLSEGPLSRNAWNDLEHFPDGRTKFERTFLQQGQNCFELISENNA